MLHPAMRDVCRNARRSPVRAHRRGRWRSARQRVPACRRSAWRWGCDECHAPLDARGFFGVTPLLGPARLHAQPGQQRAAPALVRRRVDRRGYHVGRGLVFAQQDGGGDQARQRVLDGAHTATARRDGPVLRGQQRDVGCAGLARQIAGVGPGEILLVDTKTRKYAGKAG